MAQELTETIATPDVKEYVPEKSMQVQERKIRNTAAAERWERALLTISILLSIFIGVLIFMMDDLFYLLNPEYAVKLTEVYIADAVVVLLLTVLLFPPLFFKGLEVNYYHVVLIVFYFVWGVSKAMLYKNKDPFYIGAFPLSMIEFAAVPPAELIAGIAAFSLHIVNKKATRRALVPVKDQVATASKSVDFVENEPQRLV